MFMAFKYHNTFLSCFISTTNHTLYIFQLHCLLNKTFILFNVQPRSVSSLDQQSHAPNVDADAKTVAMAPPVLPAPKTQLNDANVKKEKTKTPVGFKMPMMPISSVISSMCLILSWI